MSEATLILPNMRGGCATVGTTVHTLFRVAGRHVRPMARPDGTSEHLPREQRAQTPRAWSVEPRFCR